MLSLEGGVTLNRFAVVVSAASLLVVGCGSKHAAAPDQAVDAGVDLPLADFGGDAPRVDGAPVIDAPRFDALTFDAISDSAPPEAALPDASPYAHKTCANAKLLTLVGGQATVKDNTLYASNEYGTGVTCDNVVMQGPQLYYRVALQAGKTYRIGLNSRHTARVYLFGSCGAATISTDCSSKGGSGAVGWTPGWYLPPHEQPVTTTPADWTTRYIGLTPKVGADYTIAVDSSYPDYGGSFTLSIEAVTTPKNATCAKASQLPSPSQGPIQVTGSIVGTTNEFPATQLGKAFPGGQLYYGVDLVAGTTYSFTLLQPWDSAGLYVVGKTCDPTQIYSQAFSAGKAGDLLSPAYSWQGAQQLTFKAPVTGGYMVAVEGQNGGSSAGFTLMVNEVAPPANDACSAAETITLVGGSTRVAGSVEGATHEFPKQISCGTTGALDEPEVYYKVDLTAGKSYVVRVEPSWWFQQLRYYVFSGVCAPAAINSACVVNGVGVTPAKTATYTIAVEGTASSEYGGAFALVVEELKVPAHQACTTPKPVALQDAAVRIFDDTTGATNELGAQVTYGTIASSHPGPQLYYQLSMNKDRYYRVQHVGASAPHVFSGTCSAASINASGAKVVSKKGKTFVVPTTSGVHRIAVDGTKATDHGPFALQVEELAPFSGTCANAATLSLSKGRNVIRGELVLGEPDQLSVTCGQSNPLLFGGSQLFYRVWLDKGKTHHFRLKSQLQMPMIYIFRTTCTTAAINADCGSNGFAGVVFSKLIPLPKHIVPYTPLPFSPAASGLYTIVVASRKAPSVPWLADKFEGPFALEITVPF